MQKSIVVVQVLYGAVSDVYGIVEAVADPWQVWVHREVNIILLLVIINDAKSLILKMLLTSLLFLRYLGSVVKVI